MRFFTDRATRIDIDDGQDNFRHRIAQLRPRRVAEAYLRLRTLPGEQAQMDWAQFGKLTIGRAERPLMAFVMVLSYSRYTFLRFYLNATLANLVRGHVAAFAAFGGCARVVLYDNMRNRVQPPLPTGSSCRTSTISGGVSISRSPTNSNERATTS